MYSPLPRYAELHCLSNFSFQRGASRPEELVLRAAGLGYSALAITDECSVAGVVRAHVAARDLAKAGNEAKDETKNKTKDETARAGMPLIIGSEFVLADGPRVVLLAANRQGYGRLCALITLGRGRAAKGSYRLTRADFESGLEDCLALLCPPSSTLSTPAARAALLADALWLGRCFPGRAWIAAELLRGPDDRARLESLREASRQSGLPLVAAGDVHMHVRSRRRLSDVLTAIRLGRPVSECGTALQSSGERHLRMLLTLAEIYPPELLAESVRIAERCIASGFTLDDLRYEYPEELVPAEETASSHLRKLTEEGLIKRFPEGVTKKIRDLIEKELALIAELKYEHFFLTVHDIVRFARAEKILCQGRGSAANSAVCYALGITEVNPGKQELLFERFLSRERNEPPDIDVDFEHERREEVIQYIYKKYGRHRAAIAATVICYRPKSALRDVGKALGLPQQQVDRMSNAIAWWDSRAQLMARLAEAGFDPDSPVMQNLIHIVQALLGFPRHLSQHVGGFVISRGPLSELVPIENAAMEKRSVIQWDKDDLDSLGLLKVDVLALGMLTVIRKALEMVNADGRAAPCDMPLILADEDKDVYRMIRRADTVGVFQIESRAQMSMLPRLKPREFYDLVIEVAIVRPGPIQGGMVHPYLQRRENPDLVEYPSEAVKGVLKRTLGVPIFQEQVIKLAEVAAGFTAGESDQLRRSMAAWSRKGGLGHLRERLIGGMLKNGYKPEFAERIYKQIMGFGEYGFPESHSVSFALLSYVSAWLKFYHPAAFLAALLNSQPMGFYAPAQLVQDARRHGVKVLPVEVNTSQWDCTLEECTPEDGAENGIVPPSQQPSVRLGLRMVRGLSQAGAGQIIAARRDAPFQSVADLHRRVSLALEDGSLPLKDGSLPMKDGPWPMEDRHAGIPAWHDKANASPAPQTLLEPALPEPTLLERALPKPASSARAAKHSDLKHLAAADALQALAGHRRQAFWQVAGLERGGGLLHAQPVAETPARLPAPSEGRNLVADYASTGLTLGRHPLALLRARLARMGFATARDLAHAPAGRGIKVAGVVTGRQRPGTASGVVFVTLEDETGNANIIVWRTLVDSQRKELLGSRLMGVHGTVERAGHVVHLLARRLSDHSALLGALATPSRDFH